MGQAGRARHAPQRPSHEIKQPDRTRRRLSESFVFQQRLSTTGGRRETRTKVIFGRLSTLAVKEGRAHLESSARPVAPTNNTTNCNLDPQPHAGRVHHCKTLVHASKLIVDLATSL